VDTPITALATPYQNDTTPLQDLAASSENMMKRYESIQKFPTHPVDRRATLSAEAWRVIDAVSTTLAKNSLPIRKPTEAVGLKIAVCKNLASDESSLV
jgi:hypothetical protein